MSARKGSLCFVVIPFEVVSGLHQLNKVFRSV